MTTSARGARLPPLLLLVAIIAMVTLTTVSTLTSAQHANKEFETKPVLSYTFDTDPKATILPSVGQLQSAGSAFEYTYGAGTHTGVLSFDGWQDYLDFRRFYDNDGKNMSTMLLGGEMSFEVWACWTEIRTWSRIFDFGASADGRSDNIFLSNQGSSATIAFDVQVGTQGSGYLQYTGGVSLNKWRHIVVTVTATGSATANQAARHTMYVDGVQVATKLGLLPNVQQRPSSWLGRSNWETWGDARFRGLFDDVFVYNYSIGAEAVMGHYLVPRIAVLELTFHVDPRINMGTVSTGTSTFGWVASDPTDTASNRAAHMGLLALNADSSSAVGPQQLLNIATYDGASAIGTILPPIGGDGWSTADDDTIGWTFETTFKVTTITPNACVFDFSAATATGADRIAFCFSQSGSSVIFLTSNSRVGNSFALDVLTSVSANVWYHVVVDVQPLSTTAGTARFEAFVNGVFRNSKTTGVWPDRVTRSLAYVGRSSVNPSVRFFGYIDSLRVYDYSLTASEMVSLAAAANGEPVAQVQPLYLTGPTVSHTFDVSIPWGERNGGTKLGWEQAVSGRPGVMTLTSSDSQYVNLLTLPDRNYNLFSGFIGGRSMSFEFWVLWNRFNSWQRLLDLSASSNEQRNNAFMDNIFVATLAQSDSTQAATMVFAVVAGPEGFSDARVMHSGEVRLNRWYHVVLTVKVDRTINPVLSTAAQLQLYVDGNLDQQTNTAVPRFVSRPNSWIGRSRYSADAYLTASIDAFHYYDYALELEQVRAHYLVPRPPLFELTFSSEPSTMPLMNTTDAYGWASIDETSGIAGQTNHPGVLTFDASRWQHVDLTVAGGRTTVGTVMPQLAVLPDLTLYRTTYEFAPGTAQQRLGMTFEMSFKYSAATGAVAKLFACGATKEADVVSLGWSAGSRDLVFSVHNTDVDRSYAAVIVPNAHYEKWYHVLISMRLTNTRTFTSTWSVYVNGVLIKSDVNGVFPYVTVRRECAIGRDLSTVASSSGYVHGLIDLLRVYDYALSASESSVMYAALATVEDTYDGISPDVSGGGNGADAASSSSGLSGGAVAGIVIASVAGAALLVLLVCFRARQLKTGGGGRGGQGKFASDHVELSEVREQEEEATSDQA